MDAGVIAFVYEAGQPMRFESEEIDRGIDGLHNLMAALGMVEAPSGETKQQVEYRDSRWVRANAGGIFLTDQALGDSVFAGEFLGTITDPMTNESKDLWCPVTGSIIGMALPQVVLPGFSLFHVGLEEE